MTRILAVNITDFSGIDFSNWHDLDTLLGTKVADLINWITGISALVAVVFLIIAGYTYMTSTGDPDKVSSAGKIITGSIIGLVIIFIARILVDVILNIIINNSMAG